MQTSAPMVPHEEIGPERHGPNSEELEDRASEPVQQQENLGHGQRRKRVPSHLEDYLCYSAKSKDPSSMTSPNQKASPGKLYHIVNYINCENFSNAHRNYLAAITKVVEPRYFHEAVRNTHWREAMAKGMEALELNKTWTIEDLPP